MGKVDEQIRRAIEEGQFDNLAGKGKPIQWDENPFEDPGWRLANKILRDGGFTLPWIEARREIETSLEESCARLKLAWRHRYAALDAQQSYVQVEDEWKRAVDAFQTQIAAINKRILAYNIEVPLERFQRFYVDAEKEIEAVTKSPVDG
jgi:DnaJ family protein C protein 28